jgi:hypothetical protein
VTLLEVKLVTMQFGHLAQALPGEVFVHYNRTKAARWMENMFRCLRLFGGGNEWGGNKEKKIR